MASTQSFRATRSSTLVIAQNAAGTLVPLLPALQSFATTAEAVITDPGIPLNALILAVPPGSPLEQRPFEVVASGYINNAQSSTVTLKLYSGTSLTVGSNTLLKSSGAISAFNGKTNFFVKLRGIYDTVSGTLTGTVEFLVNNTVVAAAALTNVPTGISNNNNPVLNFVLSATFGTTTAPNQINVAEFAVNF